MENSDPSFQRHTETLTSVIESARFPQSISSTFRASVGNTTPIGIFRHSPGSGVEENINTPEWEGILYIQRIPCI